jgi:hypothetical protein
MRMDMSATVLQTWPGVGSFVTGVKTTLFRTPRGLVQDLRPRGV